MRKSFSSILRLLVCIVGGIILIYFVKIGLLNSNYWYDETGQYFISCGLNHYSPPLSPGHGIMEVINNNRYYNLDPGGFSVILYYWIKIKNAPIFLRLLPLVFYFLALFCAYKLCRKEGFNKINSFMVVVTLSMIPIVYNNATLLRAYSMEMLGVFGSLWLWSINKNEITLKRIFLLSLFLSVFMTSRYSFVIYTAGFSLNVLYRIITDNSCSASRLKYIALYIIPLLLMMGIIYFGEMIFQNKSAAPLDYLPYINNNWNLLLTSQLSYRFYFVILIFGVLHKNRHKINESLRVCVIVSVLYFSLSIMGMFPWDDKRALPMTIVQIYCIISLFIALTSRSIIGEDILSVLFLLLCVNFKFTTYTLSADRHFLYTSDIRQCIEQIDTNKSIFISDHITPDIKFLFEVDRYKQEQDRYNYPRRFMLGSYMSHNYTGNKIKKGILSADDVKCDYYLIDYSAQQNVDMSNYSKVEGYNILFVRNSK